MTPKGFIVAPDDATCSECGALVAGVLFPNEREVFVCPACVEAW